MYRVVMGVVISAPAINTTTALKFLAFGLRVSSLIMSGTQALLYSTTVIPNFFGAGAVLRGRMMFKLCGPCDPPTPGEKYCKRKWDTHSTLHSTTTTSIEEQTLNGQR